MKTIYFVRHGSTEGNESNSFQQPDILLSEEGIKQANIVARRFREIPLDVVVSSDMTRAQMTAEIISQAVDKPLVIESLFKEIMRPSAVRGRSKDDPEVRGIMNQIKANFHLSEWHHSDEENFQDLKVRAEKALVYLEKRKEEKILVVTHGNFLRMLLGVIVMGDDCTPQIYKNFVQSFNVINTGITLCKTFEGKLSVQVWNDYGHLE